MGEFYGENLFLEASNEKEKLTLKINPAKDPREFDLLAGERVVIRGIYKLDGDTLTACYPNSTEVPDRPKQFSAAKGEKQILLTLKKDKPKEK